MKWQGRLERVDVGTGAWRLHASDGSRLGLHGTIPLELDGCDVIVTGEILDGMGIGMVGTTLVRVQSVSKA